MQPCGSDESRPGPAEHRPPSARSRESLVDGLRREVADARVRLEEAGLRAETHRLLGNDAAVLDAAREQQDILAEVEARLGRVVSAAVVQRDAEEVLADVTALPADVPACAPDRREPRPRTPLLAGVASVIAVVAVSAAAVLGVTQGLGSVEVVGAEGDAEAPDQASSSSPSADGAPLDDGATPPAPRIGAPPGATVEDGSSDDGSDPAASREAVAAEDPVRTTRPSPSPDRAGVDEFDEDDPDVDQAVAELLDAVGALDQGATEDPSPDPSESDSETPTIDADISGQDADRVAGDVVPDVPDGSRGSGTDGFVPAPAAQ